MAESPGLALPVEHELDDFRITQVLGQGGFGITYKAMDVRLQREVAIKEYLPRQFAYRGDASTVLPRDDSDREVFEWGLKRFVDEARTLARFRHPNIVAVMRYLEAHGTAYLVMEYEEGRDLEAWLGLHPEGVSENVLVHRILLPVLDGLEKVHEKGLLHRDIKPENIFIRRDGTPVLIDFGASRAHGQGATVNLTSLISVGYSPFEQYGGAGRQGPWSDFYALAGTLYRVIAGQKPPDAIARQQGEILTPAVEAGHGRYSEAFLSAIDRALALDPAQRPQTAAAFREMVQSGAPAAVSGQDATLLRSRPAATADRKRRGPLRWSLGAAGTLVLAGALVLMQPEWRERLLPPFGAPPVADPEPDVVEPERPEAAADEEAAAEATPSPAEEMPVEPESQAPADAEPAAADEDAILAGLAVPGAVRDYRETQISSAMLAYVTNKTQFDTCRENGCAELVTLMGKVQEALEGYEWERPPLSGSIRVINPRRLESEECPFLIDVEETVRLADEQRSQTRTYCTRNGFDRELQTAGEVE
ncbi:MAG TPA: serine/threonine-protein kinase [Gammaproteobacteria bacterium]|nr:serine/threonine-protein kinase [Gammaproteobacteria bacterium]